VEDAALYLDCVAGYHPADQDSLPPPGLSYLECLKGRLSPLKIGFSPTLGYARVQKDVMILVEEAVRQFENMGHVVEIWDGKIPEVDQAWSELTSCDIYAQVYEDMEAFRPELGKALVVSLDHAKRLSLEDHIRNQKIRSDLNRALWDFFKRFDLLLTPTMPTEAFSAKGPPPKEVDGHPITLLGAVAFTYPFNLSGHPAATVRVGLTDSGLPAGLQIVGPRYKEGVVFQAAYAFEQACPWHDLWPEISDGQTGSHSANRTGP
jgi:aspartyl-tRNA(Asn)/glutamyl-tRNA(Gln) amidotransferase subunit A